MRVHANRARRPTTRIVPDALVDGNCFGSHPQSGAECQYNLDFTARADVESDRGNFQGAYPPLFYATMGIFAGEDILASAVIMRFVNVALLVALATASFLLLPHSRRATLVWSWLITVVPLGVFLLASNNPSSWAITGVGISWLALLGYFETTGWRRRGLGAIFVIAAIIAAGARADAAVYTLFGVAAVLILTFAPTREFLRLAILPVVMVVACGLFVLSSRQAQYSVNGFDGGGAPPLDGGEPLSGFNLVAYNLLNMPFLVSGIFGNGWGLGWLDTTMPPIVAFAAICAFAVAGFTGMTSMNARKALVAVAGFLTIWLLPTFVLVQGGDVVGQNVQPRYILPLVVLFGGVLLLSVGSRKVRFTRVQRYVLVAVLSGANFVALHMNLRRYVTGDDAPGLNLDAGSEWWWPGVPFSANAVWIVGSLAFALAAVVLVREVSEAPQKWQSAANLPLSVGHADDAVSNARPLVSRADTATVDEGADAWQLVGSEVPVFSVVGLDDGSIDGIAELESSEAEGGELLVGVEGIVDQDGRTPVLEGANGGEDA